MNDHLSIEVDETDDFRKVTVVFTAPEVVEVEIERPYR